MWKREKASSSLDKTKGVAYIPLPLFFFFQSVAVWVITLLPVLT